MFIKSLQLFKTFNSRLIKFVLHSTHTNMPPSTVNLTKKLIWVDCEMTGLDIDSDQLLEVAVIVTDANLNTVAEIGPLVIKTEKSMLDNMKEWCTTTHTASGLVNACLESQLTVEDVDQKLSDVMDELNIKSGLLAGNSVGYDRTFLNKFCPRFASYLHYRTIDVSTIKELVRLWYKRDESFKKALSHRAIDDIRESIEELRYYRDNYFKGKNDMIQSQILNDTDANTSACNTSNT